MQVNAISVNNPSFRASEEERKFAALGDDALRTIAWNRASVEAKDKRHNRIDKGIYYSLPLIGGISTLAQKMDYMPAKNGFVKLPAAKLRSAKLGRAGMVTGAWAVALTAVSALWDGKEIAEKKIQSVKEYNKEHPVFTTLATLALSLGAIVAANRLSGKVIEKYLLKEVPETAKDLGKLTKLDKFLNNNKILNSAEKLLEKTPSALKDIGKTAVDYLPWIAIGTQITHSWGHQSAKLRQANKDYAELKEAQQIIREDIADEEIDNILD